MRGGLRAGTLRDFMNQKAMDQNMFSIKQAAQAIVSSSPSQAGDLNRRWVRPSHSRSMPVAVRGTNVGARREGVANELFEINSVLEIFPQKRLVRTRRGTRGSL